jgi:hypothetical protein
MMERIIFGIVLMMILGAGCQANGQQAAENEVVVDLTAVSGADFEIEKVK